MTITSADNPMAARIATPGFLLAGVEPLSGGGAQFNRLAIGDRESNRWSHLVAA